MPARIAQDEDDAPMTACANAMHRGVGWHAKCVNHRSTEPSARHNARTRRATAMVFVRGMGDARATKGGRAAIVRCVILGSAGMRARAFVMPTQHVMAMADVIGMVVVWSALGSTEEVSVQSARTTCSGTHVPKPVTTKGLVVHTDGAWAARLVSALKDLRVPNAVPAQWISMVHSASTNVEKGAGPGHCKSWDYLSIILSILWIRRTVMAMGVAERISANASANQDSTNFVAALGLRVIIATAVRIASSARIAASSVRGTRLAVRTADVNIMASASVIMGTVGTRVCNAIPPFSERIALKRAIGEILVTVQAGAQVLGIASVTITHQETIARFVPLERMERIVRPSAQPTKHVQDTVDVKATAAVSVSKILSAAIAAHASRVGLVTIVMSNATLVMATVAALQILNANAMAATAVRPVGAVQLTCLELIAVSNALLRIAAGMGIVGHMENAFALKVTLEHHAKIASTMSLATRAKQRALGIPHAVLMGGV